MVNIRETSFWIFFEGIVGQLKEPKYLVIVFDLATSNSNSSDILDIISTFEFEVKLRL